MDYRPKIPLDYSSPAEEQKRDKQREDERRKALDTYNESTYGEAHPYASAFLRLVIFAVIAIPLMFLLPRWLQRPFLLLASISGGNLRYRQNPFRLSSVVEDVLRLH